LFQRKIFRFLTAFAVGAVLALLLSQIALIEEFENRSYDLRVRALAPGLDEDSPIRMVYLDQTSLDWMEDSFQLGWPWPREVYGYLLDYFAAAGAQAIMLDVLYTEASTFGVGDDASFASAISRAPGTVIAAALTSAEGDGTIPSSLIQDWPSFPGELNAFEYRNITLPASDILASVDHLANVQLSADGDGIFRRAELFGNYRGTAVPSLGSVPLVITGTDFEFRDGRWFADDTPIPSDRRGEVILRYRGGSQSYPTVNAASVIRSYLQVNLDGEEPDIPPEYFEGTYVYFGFSAPGLKDLRPTPVAGDYPGVEVHATVLDNLLNNSFIRSPVPLLAALYALLFCGFGALIVFGGTRGALLYLLLPLPVGLGFLAYWAGIWMPTLIPVLGLSGSLITGSLINYSTEGRQKRFIRQAFSQYLSPMVIQNLLEDPKALRLGGEKRPLSIFFSDLQGFTSISENLSPEELTALLNEYLSAMTEIILEEGGTIDKYEGDAIIAFWNAPISQEDHASRMLRAALRCQQRLADLRPGFRQRIGRDMYMRIGMNSGDAVVGNMGSNTRFDYTMLGDAVNLAARLEGVNKSFGTYTMISHSTREQVIKQGDGFCFRELGRIQVVGKSLPVTVFEPFLASEYPEETVKQFESALKLWYDGAFEQAAAEFSALADFSGDPAAKAYLQRIRDVEAGLVSAAPGSDPSAWDGRWVMMSK
jgi:adenylate cyclase